MWTPSLLCYGHGDLGVAAAGALGARLHSEGEHEAIAGPCVGGHDESGVYCAFLPQRQVLGACIARRVHGDGSVEKVGVASDPKRVGPASRNLEYG